VRAYAQRHGLDYADAVKMRQTAKAIPYFEVMMAAYAKSLEVARV
jgi:hypothetical protein